MAGADVVFCGTKFTLASVTAGRSPAALRINKGQGEFCSFSLLSPQNAQVSGSQAIARRPKD
jgi:hypothetical protein